MTKSTKSTKSTYVIIRAKEAGVFVGILVSEEGDRVTLKDSRRLWYWAGAASLSEMALKGPSKPGECKFPAALPEHVVLGVIEIIPCTPEAVAAIAAVPVWTAH